MAFVIKDRVFEYTTTTGTGTLTLAGTKSGYQQFATVGDGNTTYYTIVAENGDWESGIGTYTSSGTTLARTTVLASSNSNSPVNFAAGTKEVFSSQPAGRAVAVDTLDTSTNLGSSNLLVPSQKAVKEYVDNGISANQSFRNKIINGNFLVNQRYGVTKVIPVGTGYVPDHWQLSISQASKISAQTSSLTPVNNNLASILTIKTESAVAAPVASDYFLLNQNIENIYCLDLMFGTAVAKPVTLSFWVKGSMTGSYSVSIRNKNNNRSYLATYSIVTADTWEYKTITVPGDTSGTWDSGTSLYLMVSFNIGSGSTYTTSTANAWLSGNYTNLSGSKQLVSTASATLLFTNIQLETGNLATQFETINLNQILNMCLRYYENFSGFSQGGPNYTGSYTSFKVFKRVMPTLSIIDSVGDKMGSFAWQSVSTRGAGYNHEGGGFISITAAANAEF